MADDDEWAKLPTTGKLQHQQWKARVAGYTEVIKLFESQDSPNSSAFNEYLGLIKKFAGDPNAIAQEMGLKAVLSFLENADIAPKCAGDVCPLLVSKGLGSTRAKTKDTSIECLLQFVEIERQDLVCEELLKGISNKNPKIAIGCLQTLREALNLFGPKVISLGPLSKEIPRLLDAREKNVRDEAKNVMVEALRWTGPNNKSLLNDVKPVVVTEINTLVSNLPEGKATPTRYLKSQRPKVKPKASEQNTVDTGKGDQENIEEEEPEDFTPVVEILSRIPKEYWTLIVEKKWQERAKALADLEALTNIPKIEPGDFGDICRSLLNVISKDANIVLVTTAARITGQLATGLGKAYTPYAHQTIAVCLEKFKERKPNVIAVLRTVVDAAAKSINLEQITDDLLSALKHKTPGVRSETALFMSRIFLRCNQSTLTKKLLKQFCAVLCTTCNDTVLEVRESSFAALGAAMHVVTAKNIEPFIGELDAIRLGRIKECCDQFASNKASNDASQSTGKRPTTAPSNDSSAPSQSSTSGKPRRAPPAQRPTTAASADVPKDASGDSKRKPASGSKSTGGAYSKSKPSLQTENLLSDEQLTQQASELLGAEIVEKLSITAWKDRLAAVTEMQEKINSLPTKGFPTQILCRVLLIKPGLKDTNVMVLKGRVELLSAILKTSGTASSNLAEVLTTDLIDKIGDAKVGEAVRATLTQLAECTEFELVGKQVLQSVAQSKNPLSQSASLNWVAQNILDFGMGLNPKELVAVVRTGLSATNPTVRQSSLALAGVMHLFMGDALRNLFTDEKPAVVTLLEGEFGKNTGKRPPAPTKGSKASSMERQTSSAQNEQADERGNDNQVIDEIDTEALIPRVDISDRITSDLMDLFTSKNWKERQQGLSDLQTILTSAGFIEGANGCMQEPLKVVAKLCSDSNKILGKTALQLLANFATALSKSDATKYLKTVEPSILSSLGDAKPHVREAALAALNAWQSRVPFVAMCENDMLADALKVENAFLRSELLRWLTPALEKLPANFRRKLPPEFSDNFLPYVFASMEDRNPDPRKQAQLILPQLIRVLGWDCLFKAAGKLKAASKDSIVPQLEKAKEAVMSSQPTSAPEQKVVRPSDKPKEAAASQPASEEVEANDADDADQTNKKSRKKPGPGKTPVPSKKQTPEEVPEVALLQANKTAKSGRVTDEKKRKILKWDFDAPTRDHIAQLNQLFLTAGCSPDLHALLFHADFKQHIKALDLLTRFLDTEDGVVATHCNMDLLLRWIVLRFFETSPVVVGRCMDYVTKLFVQLSETGLNISEQEASSFLPYLVVKAGDAKDGVRQSVRSIFKLVVNLYPPPRLFTFLVTGTRSKVNKTRQECLEEMGSLIERFGIGVCQPSMPVALKAIAQQISDRDSGVRSAALNALVSSNVIIGDQIWKIVNDISDKDRTMLEERIRRSGRPQTATAPESSEPTPTPRKTQPGKQGPSESRRPLEPVRTGEQGNQPVSAAHARALAILNEFGDLTPEKEPAAPNLVPVDDMLEDLYKPVELPTLKQHTRQPVLNTLLRTCPDTTSAITLVVTAISSSDHLKSCNALAELDTVIRDEKFHLLMDHVNQTLMLITMQLKQVTTRYFGDPSVAIEQLSTLVRCHLATLESLFSRLVLAREASRETLRELLQALFHILLDERTAELADGEQIIRAINLLCVRILNSANATRVLSALIHLLHESVSSGQYTNRFVQVIMKSLWRITKGMDSTINTYALDVVLLDCHHFLKAYPSASWKSRASDVPLRTVKTMLHVMCRLLGSSVMDFLESIPNKEDSELEAYLIRTIQTTGGVPSLPNPTRRASTGEDVRKKALLPFAVVREKLTEIFQKIGSDQADQGLNELYDFTVTYPDTDLTPFLSNSGPYFQTFVKRALHNIAIERSRKPRTPTVGSMTSGLNRLRSSVPATLNGMTKDWQSTELTSGIRPTTADGQMVNAKVYMDRLALLRHELGLHHISPAVLEHSPSVPIPSKDENDDVVKGEVSEDISEKRAEVTEERRPTMSVSQVKEIRRRLDQLKSAQNF